MLALNGPTFKLPQQIFLKTDGLYSYRSFILQYLPDQGIRMTAEFYCRFHLGFF